MFDFDLLAKAIVRQTVLCVGDLMLDEFVYGEVSRISPEAPAPVLAVRRSETKIGGAGNGARNIDVLAIMREVRRTGTLTLKEVAARLACSEEAIRHSIAALGMTESVRRLFRLRRRAARRAAAANAALVIATPDVRAIATRRSPAVRVA